MKWFDRIFDLEEINGAERCPTYLFRWTLLRRKNWSIYLHHFVGDDWSLDYHDHPKRFISFGLWGKYREATPSGTKIYRAPWIRSFPATHIHRLSMIDGGTAWTLVIVLKAVRPWGFWHIGKFIFWKDYVGSETADKMKACD